MLQAEVNSDDKARGCLNKALELKKEKKFLDAIDALHSLSDNKVRYGPMYKEAVSLLIELCLSQAHGVKVDLLFPAFRWNNRKVSGNQHLEDGTRHIVNTTLDHLDKRCKWAYDKVDETKAKRSECDLILSSLSGISIDQRVKDLYLVPAEKIVGEVAREMLTFNVIGHSGKLLPIYLETTEKLIELCRTYKFRAAIGHVADSFVRFFLRFLLYPIRPKTNKAYSTRAADALKIDRESFHRDVTAAQKTVSVFCQLLEALIAVSNWQGAWRTLECFTKVLAKTKQHEDFRKSQSDAYLVMATLFWECSCYSFHAHCLLSAAFLADDERKESLLSRAVLAALCVPNIKGRESFARGSDSFFQKNEQIAKLLDLKEAPSRNFLVQRMQQMQLLQAAPKGVVAVVELLRNEVFDGEASSRAIAQVSQVVQKDQSLEKYQQPLRKVVMKRFLEYMATKVTRVEASSLRIWESEQSEGAYVNEIEPYILHESGITVEIDHKTNSITFSNATKIKVLEAFDTLAQHVQLQPAASRRKLDIKPDHLRLVHERTRNLYNQQQSCEEAAEQRRKDAKLREREKRSKERAERIENEKKKKEAADLAKESQGIAKYNEYVNQERRKLLLRRLREKYKGFLIKDIIAQKNSNDFVQEVTKLLADHLKITTQEKAADVTRMNHFERACRELEIPRRRTIEEEEADKHKAERAAARENFLAQHRNEFEKRQQDNQLLRKFLKEAASFQQQMPTKGKVSKRDEQQMLLEMEKERLQGK
ncbi:hypothetical protein, conserved [Trypanosoma brucei brucei TREU927]|uniref:Eukaryotic translation initiation factor 3 subunit A n=1 Tax=Trypanosoma brucei brucei (strain 927/4 GUTat10.1) TaxID=185431 RepID=Q57VK2_TRYB2|nr:hypothetical protein, conserved [Trypanosoma brucei brucei TREU927]AAX70367.1 hypothetical protein, conserved [Trypanosoma brucei]AAZ12673.1 hypothetical protein, conserved [Trypanosoma brucei brucei TREU927]